MNGKERVHAALRRQPVDRVPVFAEQGGINRRALGITYYEMVTDGEKNAMTDLAWHDLILTAGPWHIEGAMPTMPGFDPGRALARPQGTFVLLRDVHIGLAGAPGAEDVVLYGWVNRYVVDRVEADIDLGFFFPGAEGAAKAPEPAIPGSAG